MKNILYLILFVFYMPNHPLAEMKIIRESPPPSGRSASYYPTTQNENLKRNLSLAGIPFTLEYFNEREYIIWAKEHINQVDKIINGSYSNDNYGKARLLIDVGKIEKGMKLLEKAANEGNPEAQIYFGVELISGRNIEADHLKAFKFYQAAAEKKHSMAYVNLGMAYYYGQGTKKNHTKAFDFFQKAAKDNQTLGMWMIGKFYRDGLAGIKKNPKIAEEWFNKAKKLGADYSFLK